MRVKLKCSDLIPDSFDQTLSINLFVMIILGVVSREVLLVGGDGERKHFAAASLAELDVGVEEIVQSGKSRATHVVTITHQ